MKEKYTALLLCLVGMLGYGQYFSGEIQYKTKVIDKKTGLLVRMHTSTLQIGEGYYRYRANTQHEFTYEITYLKGDTKYYSESVARPYIIYFWQKDTTHAYTPYTFYEDSTDTVLNQPVTLATKSFSNFEEKLYLSDALRLDPKEYTNFHYAQFNEKSLQFEGRIRLKSVQEREEVFIITEAVKIKRKKLKPRHFRFPKAKNIAARFDMKMQREAYYNNLSQEYISCLYEKTNKKEQYYDTEFIEKHTKRVRFKMIWTKDQKIKDLTIFYSDDETLNQQANDIIKTCKPNFGVLKIEDTPVDMEAFYDVVFFDELTEKSNSN